MDNWTDRLSEYVDGDLDATSAEALEQHLRECADCAAITADLRFIKASAASLESAEPARDLWSGIAAQIAGDSATDTDVIDISTKRVRRRQITMSMAQLAAAAIVLVALGGGAMWALRPSNNGSYATSDTQRGVVRNASTSATDALPSQLGYDAAIEQLEQAAAMNEGTLDPKTTAVIQQSMATIDRAIADARAALAADPANAYLHRHLDRTMKQKLELLKQAARLDRGGA